MNIASQYTLPEIFVISLAHATARRSFMRAQLDQLHVRYQLFDAINVARTDALPFRYHDQSQFFLQAGRRARTEEIGCFASHVALWRRCVELNRSIVILEDDAKLGDNFCAGLSVVSKTIDTLGFIRLQTNPKRRSAKVAEYDRHCVHFTSRYPFGAMGYAISPVAAAAFIAKSTIFYAPLDKFIKNFWDHEQALFSLYPAIVDECDLGKESMIGERQRLKTRKAQYSRRFAFKLSEYFRRMWFILRIRSSGQIRTAARNNASTANRENRAARTSTARQLQAGEGTSIRPVHPV